MTQTTPVKFHLSLNVSDLERSAAFYEAFFGVPPHKRRPGYVNFDLAEPPLKLALNELALNEVEALPGAGALDHLGLQMPLPEQVHAARTRLEASGLVSFDEGDTVCCYARQDKVWVQDPDGNKWEVYVLLDDMQEERGEPVSALPMHSGDPCCPDP